MVYKIKDFKANRVSGIYQEVTSVLFNYGKQVKMASNPKWPPNRKYPYLGSY